MQPKSRQQFGKSLNGNLRKASKTVVKARTKDDEQKLAARIDKEAAKGKELKASTFDEIQEQGFRINQTDTSSSSSSSTSTSTTSSADLMLNDSNGLPFDDINIVKLDKALNSNDVEIYNTDNNEQEKDTKLKIPSATNIAAASENEVLKDHELDNEIPLHLTPLKPYVSERFDKPSKRILVNLTIATDDGSDSIYTLHVAVPTGGGSHNLEQVLTHEKKSDLIKSQQQIDSCIPEPPPRMPDCPCSCLPPNPPTYIHVDDEDDSHVDIASTTITTPSHIEMATILNHHTTEYDNRIADASSFTEPNVGLGLDGDKFACPDVMPILILEGDLSCGLSLLLLLL
ncbi:uncharacterized protein Dwil_GK27309 [Drosophila willistoni]|uniref:Uncharacterized protein n=1 Tax=Drosophila willistoni TaxID=7260 RepID=A0A0Q9WPB1_DROWI|nr:uncharacterized protein Dwil_GK27309 [Drosophila willistoni]